MTNTAANNGRFVWYEQLTRDSKKSIDFYTQVMGWKTEAFEESNDYVMWVSEQGPLGGVEKLSDEATRKGISPLWMAHVQVDNVDATAAQVKKLGGKIHKEPSDIPTVGRFAVIADPQGAMLSIFTPAHPMTLHDTSKIGEFCWNELLTSDSAAAFNFYTQIFGWKKIQDMDMGPMGTYTVFGVEDRQLGGMMTTPKGSPMPPMWIYYTETSDLNAAIGRATRNGATVMNGPMEVPGGGHIAQLTDSQGAAFALHEAPRK